MEPKHQALSGFNRCPAEILNLVFKFLSPTELRSLTLVSKDLRAVAEPLLYSKIQWTWQDGHHPPPITQLLRTIISRPQLAAYITNVYLAGNFFRGQDFRRKIAQIPLLGAELDGAITFIQRTGVPYIDLWIQELRNGTADAVIALLLAQPLLNLRCLYLGPVFIRQTALIGMVLRSSILQPMDYQLPDFQHLQDVTFLLEEQEDEGRDKKKKKDYGCLAIILSTECSTLVSLN
ncbi:hypothetical protein FE257_002998 [Aspergillus nanangensis]|uniref:F-box domain-containing protein n=1 Tax=Aspergillus nanangensis TaxID=2582783 RepID=A0AAD4CC49_ASPNN|nr:hypothetical protein FE257_002998 [Aspergillus nanangensis]